MQCLAKLWVRLQVLVAGTGSARWLRRCNWEPLVKHRGCFSPLTALECRAMQCMAAGLRQGQAGRRCLPPGVRVRQSGRGYSGRAGGALRSSAECALATAGARAPRVWRVKEGSRWGSGDVCSRRRTPGELAACVSRMRMGMCQVQVAGSSSCEHARRSGHAAQRKGRPGFGAKRHRSHGPARLAGGLRFVYSAREAPRTRRSGAHGGALMPRRTRSARRRRRGPRRQPRTLRCGT